MRVCLYVLCGHLLGKGWPLGSRLWCLLWFCHFPIGILGQVWYLIVSIPDLCTLTYLECMCKDIICTWMVLYVPYPLIWYATWLFSVENVLNPPQGSGCDRICAYMVLYAPFPFIWYATWLLSEKNKHWFDPTPEVYIVCKDRIYAWMVFCVPFPLIWYATWLLSAKKNVLTF